MTSLVFHLGDRKTGSTSIQAALAAEAWHCPTVKLLYPVRGGSTHIALARSLTDPDAKAQRQQRFDVVRREIDASQPDIVLISAELFEAVDPSVLSDCLHRFMPEYAATARFVSYVRPHVDRTLSSFAERVKLGVYQGSLADLHKRLMQSGRYVYAPRFLKWRRVFGDNFILRPFVRDRLINRDVVHDLLTIVFGTEPFELGTQPKRNESLGLEDLTMIRNLHHRLAGSAESPDASEKESGLRHAIGWNLAARLSADPAPTAVKLQAHLDLARKMREDYRDDAYELDAAFFDGTPLTDELMAAPDRAIASVQSLDLADHFTPNAVRMIGTFTAHIADLLTINPEHWEKLFRTQNFEQMTGKPKPD